MKTLLFLLALCTLFSCQTQPQLSEVVNDMVVVTDYEPSVDFTQFSTYALTMDTVGLQSNTTNDNALSNDYTKMITGRLKMKLDQTGRTQVAANQDPDLGVNVMIISDLSVSQSVIYPGGYGGYYGGYYGYGGLGYVTTNYFQSAILVIELVDLKDKVSGNKPPSLWVANIGDLINSYDTSTKTQAAIDQAFAQSQYLNK